MDYIKISNEIFARRTCDQQESWAKHSKNVAAAATKIARECGLDEKKAYAYGLLHDIGRSLTTGQFQHIKCGYEFMMEQGYTDIAKICLTHSFPIQILDSYVGKIDVTDEEEAEYRRRLRDCIYDDYDSLIQLCDAISTDTGYVCMEKKFVSSVFKYGFNDYTIEKWRKTMQLREYFRKKAGRE